MPKEPRQPSTNRYELREQSRPYYGTARKPAPNPTKSRGNSKTESTKETNTNQVEAVVDRSPTADNFFDFIQSIESSEGTHYIPEVVEPQPVTSSQKKRNQDAAFDAVVDRARLQYESLVRPDSIEPGNREQPQAVTETDQPTTMDEARVRELIDHKVTEAVNKVEKEFAIERRDLERRIEELQKSNQILIQQLDKLSPTKTLESMAKAISTLKISHGPPTNLDKPKYVHGRTPARTFLKDVEGFLAAHNHKEESYTFMVKSYLPEDLKAWYDHVAPQCDSWESFKEQFLNRFGSLVEYEKRLTELQTRKYKKFEPTEKFIYDTIELSKYCYEDNDDESAHVVRTKSKLLPELQLAIGTSSYSTVLQLIEACETATRTLEIRDETLFDSANAARGSKKPIIQ